MKTKKIKIVKIYSINIFGEKVEVPQLNPAHEISKLLRTAKKVGDIEVINHYVYSRLLNYTSEFEFIEL